MAVSVSWGILEKGLGLSERGFGVDILTRTVLAPTWSGVLITGYKTVVITHLKRP